MLNGEDNENGFKTNRSNQQKNKLHVQHTFSSSQQKTNLHVQHAFLSFPCPCFARLQRCFVRPKTSNFLVTHYFLRRNCRICFQYFVSCINVRFYFSLPLIFTLLAASISHFLTAALNFHVFLPTKLVSFVFNNSLQLFYEAVFISKILFTVQIQLCLLVIQLCPFVIQLCLLVIQLCPFVIQLCLIVIQLCPFVF